jgi:hypothetical protein
VVNSTVGSRQRGVVLGTEWAERESLLIEAGGVQGVEVEDEGITPVQMLEGQFIDQLGQRDDRRQARRLSYCLGPAQLAHGVQVCLKQGVHTPRAPVGVPGGRQRGAEAEQVGDAATVRTGAGGSGDAGQRAEAAITQRADARRQTPEAAKG